MNCSNIRGRLELEDNYHRQGGKVEFTIRNTNRHHPRREEEINEQGRNKEVAGLTGDRASETNTSDGQMTLRLMKGSGK